MRYRQAMDVVVSIAEVSTSVLGEVADQLGVARDQLLVLGWTDADVSVEIESDSGCPTWETFRIVIALDAAAYVAWGRRKLAVFEVLLTHSEDGIQALPAWIIAREALPRPTSR